MKDIKLYNRDGADLRLVKTDKDYWTLNVDDAHKYIFEYMRVGYANDNKTIEMIDPSGGPYLTIGQQISTEYAISHINHNDGEFRIYLTGTK